MQWVRDPALLQLQLRWQLPFRSDSWPRTYVCHGATKNGKKNFFFKKNKYGLRFCTNTFYLKKFFFVFFRAAPGAYGGSQARGQIGAAAASHSHSNTGSKPRLQPTPLFMATPDPSSTEQGQGSNPPPQGYWSGSLPLSHNGTPHFKIFYQLQPQITVWV